MPIHLFYSLISTCGRWGHLPLKEKTCHFNIATLNQLEYWFDGRKMNEPAIIKTTLKGIWLANGKLTAEGTALFDAIWNNNTGGANNTGLRGHLFPRANYPGLDDLQYKNAAKLDFISIVNSTNDSFYDFVKVK